MKKVIMNNFLFMYLALFTNLAVYGNDSILVNKIWTERQTIFVNEAQVDSILDDSVTEYYGIGCGYGRCEKIYFLTSSMRHPKRLTSSFKSKSGWIIFCSSVRNRVLLAVPATPFVLMSITLSTLSPIPQSLMIRSSSL